MQETSNKSIKILKHPNDQTIRFKNNEATVELTCLAEPPEGYELQYEWYCDGSNGVISNEPSAKIPLQRPLRNMEKKYYCKVSTRSKPKHHVKSKKAVIKLEISEFQATSYNYSITNSCYTYNRKTQYEIASYVA